MFFAFSKSSQRAKIQNMGVPKTIDHIQINIRMLNPSQEPPASSKAPNQDLKDMDQHRDLIIIKMVYQKLFTLFKSRSRFLTSVRNPSILLSSKSGLRGHGCPLHLQNLDRELKLGT